MLIARVSTWVYGIKTVGQWPCPFSIRNSCNPPDCWCQQPHFVYNTCYINSNKSSSKSTIRTASMGGAPLVDSPGLDFTHAWWGRVLHGQRFWGRPWVGSIMHWIGCLVGGRLVFQKDDVACHYSRNSKKNPRGVIHHRENCENIRMQRSQVWHCKQKHVQS